VSITHSHIAYTVNLRRTLTVLHQAGLHIPQEQIGLVSIIVVSSEVPLKNKIAEYFNKLQSCVEGQAINCPGWNSYRKRRLLLDKSFTDLQPIRRMPRSISVRINSSARSTPG